MIRGLTWGMSQREAVREFDGPLLRDANSGVDLIAAPVPLGPFAASILLGFYQSGLGSVRLTLDLSSLGGCTLSDALDLIAGSLCDKYGSPTFHVHAKGADCDSLTADCLDQIRSHLSDHLNGSLTWKWRGTSGLITLQYLGVWWSRSASESVMLHYERPASTRFSQLTLKAQLQAGLL